VSKTVPVRCADQEFWAYDLALGIWLKKALDEVHSNGWQGEPGASADELRGWETVAVLGANSLLDLTPRAETAPRRENFEAIATSVEAWLVDRERIPGVELASWRLLGNAQLSRSDAPAIVEYGMQTGPVVDLGRALLAAVRGSLPPAPTSTWWFFGYEVGGSTIKMRR
jgi:hypothetical protein